LSFGTARRESQRPAPSAPDSEEAGKEPECDGEPERRNVVCQLDKGLAREESERLRRPFRPPQTHAAN